MTPVLWSSCSPDAGAMAAELAAVRAAAPGPAGPLVLHVAGGVHPTAEPQHGPDCGRDLAASGEAKATILALVRALRDGAELTGVPGLAVRDDDGVALRTPPAPQLPLGAFPSFPSGRRHADLAGLTRSCRYACRSCQTPFMSGDRFRHHPAGSVREHVRRMAGCGLRHVRFLTPTSLSYGSRWPGPDLDTVAELLDGVRREPPLHGRIFSGSFPSEVRRGHVTPAAMRLLRRYVANHNIITGAQSGSDRVLSTAGRSTAPARCGMRCGSPPGTGPGRTWTTSSACPARTPKTRGLRSRSRPAWLASAPGSTGTRSSRCPRRPGWTGWRSGEPLTGTGTSRQSTRPGGADRAPTRAATADGPAGRRDGQAARARTPPTPSRSARSRTTCGTGPWLESHGRRPGLRLEAEPPLPAAGQPPLHHRQEAALRPRRGPAALSRQGRYQEAAANLQVKDVHISEHERFVICRNPEGARRDARVRARMLAQLEEMIAGSDELTKTKRARLRRAISTKPGLNRYVH